MVVWEPLYVLSELIFNPSGLSDTLCYGQVGKALYQSATSSERPTHVNHERAVRGLCGGITDGYANVHVHCPVPIYFLQIIQYDPILLPVYIFLAVFTKGPVGILVPLLTIPCFLLLKGQIKDFNKYLGWKQFSILLGLCAIWFGGVYLEGGNAYLNNLLFNQTVNRAVDYFHHKEPIWYYFKTIWYSLAPWILLYITTIFLCIKKKLINTDLKRLFVVVITTTFIALSIFSGKLDIYLLPVFPFIAYLAFLLLPDVNEKQSRFSVLIPAIILLFTFPGLFIVTRYVDFPLLHMSLIPVSAFILSVSSGVCLYFLFKKQLL